MPMTAPFHPTISPLGFDGLLVRFAERLTEPANRAALAFRAAIVAKDLPYVQETSTALVSTYIRFDPLKISHETFKAQVEAALNSQDWLQAPLPLGRRRWHVPTLFGGDAGPQLAQAARLAGVSEKSAVQSVCAQPLRVQTLGFAPGQPYLGQLSDIWDIPRLQGLNGQVPQGAVVVAIRQICLFANASPTGWRHIGQSRFCVFQSDAEAPFVLKPGDEVQFHATTKDAFAKLTEPAGGAWAEAVP